MTESYVDTHSLADHQDDDASQMRVETPMSRIIKVESGGEPISDDRDRLAALRADIVTEYSRVLQEAEATETRLLAALRTMEDETEQLRGEMAGLKTMLTTVLAERAQLRSHVADISQSLIESDRRWGYERDLANEAVQEREQEIAKGRATIRARDTEISRLKTALVAQAKDLERERDRLRFYPSAGEVALWTDSSGQEWVGIFDGDGHELRTQALSSRHRREVLTDLLGPDVTEELLDLDEDADGERILGLRTGVAR